MIRKNYRLKSKEKCASSQTYFAFRQSLLRFAFLSILFVALPLLILQSALSCCNRHVLLPLGRSFACHVAAAGYNGVIPWSKQRSLLSQSFSRGFGNSGRDLETCSKLSARLGTDNSACWCLYASIR